MKSKLKKIGVVSVDSGLMWVGDPCYIHDDDLKPSAEKEWCKSWEDFVNLLHKDGNFKIGKQFCFNNKNPGLGVCCISGFGDGTYSVFAEIIKTKDFGNRVKKIEIVFITDEEIKDLEGENDG